MKLRTDDDIYRARLVYLGPPGYTFPVHLPFAQWLLLAILTAGFTIIAVLLTGTWASAGVAIAAAIFLTYVIFQHVDPDRPARKVIKVVLIDWVRVQPGKTDQLPRLTGRKIRFSTIDTGTGDDR